jgi:hypothetical protein
MLKPHLRVEQFHVQYRIGLTMSAPEWVPERDKTGMGRRVAERLQVGRDGEPFTDSTWQRAGIDDQCAAQEEKGGFEVGDAVVCRYGAGELVELKEDGSCVVDINVDSDYEANSDDEPTVQHLSEFSSTGRDTGGARLRWPPPNFAPAPRAKRIDAVNLALKKKVAMHFEQNCPTSPCAKDRMRKWLAVGIFIFAQAMILMTTYTKLFKSFKAEHGDAISESQFH